MIESTEIYENFWNVIEIWSNWMTNWVEKLGILVFWKEDSKKNPRNKKLLNLDQYS